MEVSSGAALKSPPCFYSGAGAGPRHHRLCFPATNRIPCELNCREVKLFARSPAGRTIGEVSGFDEKGHVEYYDYRASPVCGGEKKKERVKANGWRRVSEKKRAKLLKGLSKNLSMFSELGFGLQSDDARGKIISEASEVLMAQLEHLRKEEKRAKKGELMNANINMDDSESSSSSSSESSDSECENDDVVDMSVLRGMMAAPPVEEASKREGVAMAGEPRKVEEVGVVGLTIDSANADSSTPLKRVEVCMGGKCKKLGAQVLMDEFQNVLGSEGSVVACKCMGKCKTAPNVRVRNDAEGDEEEDDSIRINGNPLFIGVRLEDVGSIVAGCFGAEQAGIGGAAGAGGGCLAAL